MEEVLARAAPRREEARCAWGRAARLLPWLCGWDEMGWADGGSDRALGAHPVIFAFCFGPMVWRAARVALAFWTLATFCSAVGGAGAFSGSMP